MKTLFLAASQGAGGGTFLPSNRGDLVNWYRKGMGMTNSGGLTVWADQVNPSTDNLNVVDGAKATINGDGTVTWAHNGLITADVGFGYNAGVHRDPPYAVYLLCKLSTRDGSNHAFAASVSLGATYELGYRASGDADDAVMFAGSINFYTAGSQNVVGPWLKIAVVDQGSGLNNAKLKVLTGTTYDTGGGGGKFGGLYLGGHGGSYSDVIFAEAVVYSGAVHMESDILQMFDYFETVIP